MLQLLVQNCLCNFNIQGRLKISLKVQQNQPERCWHKQWTWPIPTFLPRGWRLAVSSSNEQRATDINPAKVEQRTLSYACANRSETLYDGFSRPGILWINNKQTNKHYEREQKFLFTRRFLKARHSLNCQQRTNVTNVLEIRCIVYTKTAHGQRSWQHKG